MYIVDSYRSAVINIENVSNIMLDENYIFGVLTSGTKLILGNYTTEERTQEVFRGMLRDCFPPMVYEVKKPDTGMIFDNSDICVTEAVEIKQITRRVYYMPEE